MTETSRKRRRLEGKSGFYLFIDHTPGLGLRSWATGQDFQSAKRDHLGDFHT
jgi:hypothetical protein